MGAILFVFLYDEPDITLYWDDELIQYQHWMTKSKYHRDTDLPSRVWYNRNGTLNREEWYIDGVLHRENNPAIISYHSGLGVLFQEIWYANGIIHNIEGPAYIEYDTERVIVCEHWILFDRRIENLKKWLEENNISTPLSPEDHMAIKLRWMI